jgi:chemotaxis signal transduction protein
LFDLARREILESSREMLIVTERRGIRFCLVVDNVDAIEQFGEPLQSIPQILDHESSRVVSHTARRPGKDSQVLAIDVDVLIDAANLGAVASQVSQLQAG